MGPAEVNAKSHFPYVFLKFRYQHNITKILIYHKHPVLIVSNHLSSAAEILEGIIMGLDRCSRGKGLTTEINIIHPAICQNHAKEINPYNSSVHIFHSVLPKIHLRFIARWRFFSDRGQPASKLCITGLFPEFFHILIKRTSITFKIRKFLFQSVHNVGFSGLRTDSENTDDKFPILIHIRHIISFQCIKTYLIHSGPLNYIGH